MSTLSYRGWNVEPNFFGWEATHPDWEPGDSRSATGRTIEELHAEIDLWFEEHE